MKCLLGLTADFIDRMSNPIYGAAENEKHLIRFAELMTRDEDIGRLLNATDLSSHDADLLSSAGWLWYLRWRRDAAPDLPANDFLDSLYDRVVDPVFRLNVIDIACCHPSVVRSFSVFSDNQPTIESLPRCWVRDRLLALVRREERQVPSRERVSSSWAQVVEMMTLLLQIGNVVAIATVRALLATAWVDRGRLVVLVGEILRASALRGEDLVDWRRRLGLHEAGREGSEK